MIIDMNNLLPETHHDTLVFDFGSTALTYLLDPPDILVLNSEIQTAIYLSSEVE